MDAQRYNEAISHYSTALSLYFHSGEGLRILIQRYKAHVATGSWTQAVDDANQVHHFYPMEANLVDASSSGNHTRPVVAVGLRDEACSITQDRRLRQCGGCARDNALEDSAVT